MGGTLPDHRAQEKIRWCTIWLIMVWSNRCIGRFGMRFFATRVLKDRRFAWHPDESGEIAEFEGTINLGKKNFRLSAILKAFIYKDLQKFTFF